MGDRKRSVAELDARRQELQAELAALCEEINQRAGEEDSRIRQEIAKVKK